MNEEHHFPGLESDPASAQKWLSYAEDVFEAFKPDLDVLSILEFVLQLALEHPCAEVRVEAFRILQSGLVNHSESGLNLAMLAEILGNLEGEELMLALNTIGLSCDSSLRDRIVPFLDHEDYYVRAEAAEALAELEKEE